MRKIIHHYLLVIGGWVCVALGLIGVVLPVFPTTPFLIVALAFFSKSSPRFHRMLLNNRWFGPVLKQWEETKTLSRKVKYKVYFLVVITFLISISILHDRTQLQLLLVALAVILLFFIWRIREDSAQD